MSRASSRVRFAALLALALGCGRDAPAPVPDAGTKGPDDGGAPIEERIELGTGQDQFLALKDGQTVDIVKGPQGGFHVWGALRAWKLDPKNLEIEYWIDLAAGGENIAHNKYRLSLLPKGDYAEWFGMTLFILDPSKVDGKEVVIRFEAKDASGRLAQDSRHVTPHLPVTQ